MRRFLLAGWLVFALVWGPAGAWAGESDVDRLLNLLVEKGIVKQEDAAAFRADLAIKKQEEKEAQKEFTLIAGKPIKISGYTQLRYRHDRSGNDSFDIRRARVDLKGDITECFDYRTQVEFGGTSGPFLLDATIGYKLSPYVKLTAGQFKVPFSQENLTSSPKLETINRSQVVEALVARGSDVIGNQNGRDIGVQAQGSFLLKDGIGLFDYALAVVNGSGINKADTNEQKDFVARLVYHPAAGWSFGGNFYSGRYTLSSAPAKKDDRDRIGGEFAYVRDPISLKGEYIAGHDGSAKKSGWYVQAAYFAVPKKLQLVYKFDTFDSNTETADNEKNVHTLGANWYFNKWAFFQLDYEIKDERGKELRNNSLIGQLTLQF